MQYVDVGSAKRASQMHTKYDLEDYSNHAHNLFFFFPNFHTLPTLSQA